MKTAVIALTVVMSTQALAADPEQTAAPEQTPAPAAQPPAGEVTEAPPPTPLVRLSAEIDPLDYTWYRGWGLFVAARFAALPRWRFRLGGGAANIPSQIVDMVPDNKGWGFRLEPVITAAVHFTVWRFHNNRGGLFLGPVGGFMRGVFHNPAGERAELNTGFVGADLGFRWYPFQKLGLVISPHLGVISTLGVQAPKINGTQYKVMPVIPQPQLLIGYEFDIGKAAND